MAKSERERTLRRTAGPTVPDRIAEAARPSPSFEDRGAFG